MDTIMKAARVAPPREGAVYRFSATASNQVFEVPTAWRNAWIRMEASGGDVDYVFGSHSGLSLTVGQGSSTSGTPVELTPSSASGEVLRDGMPEQMHLGDADRYLAVRSAGTVSITVSVRS